LEHFLPQKNKDHKKGENTACFFEKRNAFIYNVPINNKLEAHP